MVNSAKCKQVLVTWCSIQQNISDLLWYEQEDLDALVKIKKWRRFVKKKEGQTIIRIFENVMFEGTLIAKIVTDDADKNITSIELQEWPADEWRREYK